MKAYKFYLFFLLCLSVFLPEIVFADARLFLTQGAKQIEEGDRVSVYARISSSDQSINAITGAVSFSSDLLKLISISKDESIINFWTEESRQIRDRIVFEGVILNPGFQADNGVIFKMTFEAKNSGLASINFIEGGVLANDGLGSNILTSLGSTSIRIIRKIPTTVVEKEVPSVVPPKDNTIVQIETETTKKLVALPVITEYPPSVYNKEQFIIKGRGEPNTTTRIVFKDVSIKSLGERFISILQTKREKLDEALVKNDENGAFEYISPKNLVAGVYNATPFLVDEEINVEKPGFGAQLLVLDSKVVKFLVVLINVLGLLIPVVILIMIIYFIPWYSWLKMRVLKKKIDLEEEKIAISGHQLERQEKLIDKKVEILENEQK